MKKAGQSPRDTSTLRRERTVRPEGTADVADPAVLSSAAAPRSANLPAHLLGLQRAIGNQATQRTLAHRHTVSPRTPIQRLPVRVNGVMQNISATQLITDVLNRMNAVLALPGAGGGFTFLHEIQSILQRAQGLPEFAPALAAHQAAIVAALGHLQANVPGNLFNLVPLCQMVGYVPPIGHAPAHNAPAAAHTATAQQIQNHFAGNPYIRMDHIRQRHRAADYFNHPGHNLNFPTSFFPLAWNPAFVQNTVMAIVQTPEMRQSIALALANGQNWGVCQCDVNGYLCYTSFTLLNMGPAPHQRVRVDQMYLRGGVPTIPPNGPNGLQAFFAQVPAPTWHDFRNWLINTHQQP